MENITSYTPTNGTNMTIWDNQTIVVKGECSDDNYTHEQYLEMIDTSTALKANHWFFIVIFIIIFFIGITGNFLVCYSVWKSKQLKSVTNFFLVNLAVADFWVILICLPPSVLHDMMKSWFLGVAMCKIIVYLQRVSVFVSVLTLTAISIERYLAICHPLTFHGATFRTKLAIAIIWAISLITPSVDLFNKTIKHFHCLPERYRPWFSSCVPIDEKIEKEFNIFSIVAFYFIPLSVMGYTYVKIAYCLWSSTLERNAVAENLQHETAIEQLRVRRRTAKMLIVIVVAFAVCYFPIHFLDIARYLEMLGALDKQPNLKFNIWMTARILIYANSCINPIVYNFMSEKFRKQFMTACFGCYKLMRCCFRRDNGFERPSEYETSKSFSTFRTNNVRLTFVTKNVSRSSSD